MREFLFKGKQISNDEWVEVVRCKNCKYRDPENHHCDHPTGCTVFFPRKDEDFCSYGERKEP